MNEEVNKKKKWRKKAWGYNPKTGETRPIHSKEEKRKYFNSKYWKAQGQAAYFKARSMGARHDEAVQAAPDIRGHWSAIAIPLDLITKFFRAVKRTVVGEGQELPDWDSVERERGN